MIISIIEGISVALNEEFGDSYEIHMEEIRQGMQEPCFFISPISPVFMQYFSNRYQSVNPYCIQYFPAGDEVQRECASVAERMCGCLEYITVSGDTKPVRGTKMSYQVVDGVLNFFVNYDLFVVRKKEEPAAMESMQAGEGVKEGD